MGKQISSCTQYDLGLHLMHPNLYCIHCNNCVCVCVYTYTYMHMYVCELTISWQNFAFSDIAPYLEWQLSLWVPHRTLMSVHVTHSKPGQELQPVRMCTTTTTCTMYFINASVQQWEWPGNKAPRLHQYEHIHTSLYAHVRKILYISHQLM